MDVLDSRCFRQSMFSTIDVFANRCYKTRCYRNRCLQTRCYRNRCLQTRCYRNRCFRVTRLRTIDFSIHHHYAGEIHANNGSNVYFFSSFDLDEKNRLLYLQRALRRKAALIYFITGGKRMKCQKFLSLQREPILFVRAKLINQ